MVAKAAGSMAGAIRIEATRTIHGTTDIIDGQHTTGKTREGASRTFKGPEDGSLEASRSRIASLAARSIAWVKKPVAGLRRTRGPAFDADRGTAEVEIGLRWIRVWIVARAISLIVMAFNDCDEIAA